MIYWTQPVTLNFQQWEGKVFKCGTWIIDVHRYYKIIHLLHSQNRFLLQNFILPSICELYYYVLYERSLTGNVWCPDFPIINKTEYNYWFLRYAIFSNPTIKLIILFMLMMLESTVIYWRWQQSLSTTQMSLTGMIEVGTFQLPKKLNIMLGFLVITNKK